MDNDELFELTIWGDPAEGAFDAAHPPAAGRLDPRVLYQQTSWVDGQGRCWRLSEMSPAHRRNVVAYLVFRCRELHRLESWWETFGLGMSAGSYLAQQASGAPWTSQVDPYTWIESTPLVRALRQRQDDVLDPQSLRSWAEATHRQLKDDPQAAVWLPQEPGRALP